MSEIKPVYQVKRFDETGWADVTQESYKNCELAQTILETRILYPAAAYEELEAENEAQAKRIAELEEHVTKLGSGSRQHLYQAFARRYREILSLRQENEAQAKRIEEIKGFLEACVDDSMSRNNRQQLAGELLDMLNGDSK